MARRGHGNKAVIVALGANVVIASATGAGFVVTGSWSMLGATAFSLAAAATQVLLLLAGRRSRKDATPDHPFAYGRERYFWSFVVSIGLFALGSAAAISQGILELRDPQILQDPDVALGILAGGIVIQAVALRTAVRESRAAKGTATYRKFIRHAKVPELPVVLLHDLGATTVLVLATAAVTAAKVTEDPAWDAYGAIGVGTVLGVIAIVLVSEMKSLLIGNGASHRQLESIEAAILIEPGVLSLIHMRTEHIGPDELLVCAKVEFDHRFTLPEVAEAVNRVERAVRTGVPSARMIYLEPDVARDKRGAAPVAEHEPTHDVPDEIRTRMDAERRAVERPTLPPAN